MKWSCYALVTFLFGLGCRDLPTPTPPVVNTELLDPMLASTIQAHQQAVIASPNSADAWGRLGQVLHAAEYQPEAIICYRHASERNTASVRWWYLLGLLQLSHHPEEGLLHLQRAAELAEANDHAPCLRLSQALIERGRFDEAVQTLQLILRTAPDHPAARLGMARIRHAQGDLSAARDLLRSSLTNPHTSRPAALLLSQVQARLGDTTAAIELATRASALPRLPEWPDPYLREIQQHQGDRARRAERAAALLGQGRLDDAEREIEVLQHQAPKDPEVILLAGRLLVQQRRCAEAEARFREHLSLNDRSLSGWIQLAVALLCQDRWADAIPPLERALALKPDFAQAHANLGLARARLGDTTGAIRSYRDALSCAPGDANTHAALAEQLAQGGDLPAAQAHLRRALDLDPDQPRALGLSQRLLSPR